MLKALLRINIGKHDTYRKDKYLNPSWDILTITDMEESEYRAWSGDNETTVLTVADTHFPNGKMTDKEKSSYLGITSLTSLEQLTGIDYDLTLCLSGNGCIEGSLDDFVNKTHKGEVSAVIHAECENPLQDAVKIIKFNKDTLRNVKATIRYFNFFNFSEFDGYHETSGMIKSKTAYAKILEKIWATEYLSTPSGRDQMTLPFARWLVSSGKKDKRFVGYEKTEMNGYFL